MWPLEQRLGNRGVIDPNVPERLQHVDTFGGKDVNGAVEPFELNLIRLELGGFMPIKAYGQGLNTAIKGMRGHKL
jgi:hypothetical protein